MRDVLGFYRERATALRESERRCAARSRRISRVRVILAVAIIASLWGAWRLGGRERALLLAVSGVGALLFALAVVRHGRVRRQEQLLGELAEVNEMGPARVERRWSSLTREALEPAPTDHAYAVDLDITGAGSLARLLPPLSPALGAPLLRSWLLSPASPEEIPTRQDAIAELSPMYELRELLAVHGARSGLGAPYVRAFEQWAAEPPWWSTKRSMVWMTRAIPAAMLVLAFGPPSSWLIPLALGTIITGAFRKRVSAELRRVIAPVSVFRAYREMVTVIVRARFTSPTLRALQATLGEGPGGAERAMRSLGWLADCAELRYSGLQHVIVQALTLWDFHVLELLERWRARASGRVPRWFAAIAEMEALAALAMLAHDNPDWSYPRVARDAEPLVRGRALGHPLLAPTARMPNDVNVGPPGSFLFITGSNMSGKSTLARAIGLNVVLAQAGSAACAAELVLPPLALHTSMRVQDSIERGVSLFMAEVERLRGIVDAARNAAPGDRVLYLLDEILHGTNSAERTIAARGVLRRLLELGAIGAVTSHDLQLADAPPLRDAAVAVHFREEVLDGDGGPRMHFDYLLRPGKATTRNALRLMAEMGLPVEEMDRNEPFER